MIMPVTAKISGVGRTGIAVQPGSCRPVWMR